MRSTRGRSSDRRNVVWLHENGGEVWGVGRQSGVDLIYSAEVSAVAVVMRCEHEERKRGKPTRHGVELERSGKEGGGATLKKE